MRRHGDDKQIQRGFCRKVKMYASVEVVGTKQVRFTKLLSHFIDSEYFPHLKPLSVRP